MVKRDEMTLGPDPLRKDRDVWTRLGKSDWEGFCRFNDVVIDDCDGHTNSVITTSL